ncbi:MAG: phosphoadenylyl-sulfate reductase [Planctomycetes bacterium]|nr:phosphoadenylyl-sulfate reductase [Planctomycetota bacterium]
MDQRITKLEKITQDLGAQALLAEAVKTFDDKIALASSFSIEDQVITHMLLKLADDVRIFTLDTGRLPQETYDVIDQTRKKYGIKIEMLTPDSAQLTKMLNDHGPNLFYERIDNRRLCCQVRKVAPLKKKLAQLDAWICGLRSDQSVTRSDLKRIDWDSSNQLVKILPLADWTLEQTWEYIRKNDIPYNKLHDMNYPSIGCAPCTRPVKDGENIRAGRWWWEQPEHKECGLHLSKDKRTDPKETI